ncbi:MAG: MBL fold metallo-hydrolase [Isosphaeraceae bacterium]|nr:MBL fold metallo-hydrolase [Isosphaeraceae bacterium]
MRHRNSIFPGLAFAISAILTTPTLAGDNLSTGSTRGRLTLTCLEIPDYGRGAGLAVVIQTPGGKTFLYDSGSGYPTKDGKGWEGNYNAGRDAILPFLRAKGITSIDGVLISHGHFDHFGGLLWLVDHATIPKLIDSGYSFRGGHSSELAAYENLRNRFKKVPGAYVEAHTGDMVQLDPALKVEVLFPPHEYFQGNPLRTHKKDTPEHYLPNANSLGIRITHGDVVFLLPGDVQVTEQVEVLLPRIAPEKLRCNILVAPAHGIDAAPEFAQATHPEVTIASASGRYATWSATPKVYGGLGSRVFVTGTHGRVSVISDGKSYTLDVEREPAKPLFREDSEFKTSARQ